MEERQQQNYTIAEGYELPSKGLIYEGVSVNPHVDLRSMTARDEMKRLNSSTTPFKTLATLIENCMLEKPAIPVYDMAFGDYEFLLHKLRIVSYGDEYKMTVTCPFCGSVLNTVVHLDELEVKEFDQETFDSLRAFTLPDCKRLVTIKIQTPHILDNIDNRTRDLEKRFKDSEIDFRTFVLVQEAIDTVDGEKLSQIELEKFINNLSSKDFIKIQNNFAQLSTCIGVDTQFIAECPHCKNEVKTFFRFEPEFFRPTNI